jgi:hypothetical protein
MLHYKVDSLAISGNIRLGWKVLPGTNTPAYYEQKEIADTKSFIRFGLSIAGTSLRFHFETLLGSA